MLSPRPVGRNAAVAKYDLLTALGTFALARDKHDQRLILRLITLITARYNWMRNELAVGQREIARLWSVDERTVKREMAKLRARGWLIVTRQGARGHVTEYRLDIEEIRSATREDWSKVGPDYELRMSGEPESNSVVPLRPQRDVPAPPEGKDDWTLAQGLLHREDANTYGSWLGALKRVDRAGGRLTLQAPSRFHAAYVQTHLLSQLLRACKAVDEAIDEVCVIA